MFWKCIRFSLLLFWLFCFLLRAKAADSTGIWFHQAEERAGKGHFEEALIAYRKARLGYGQRHQHDSVVLCWYGIGDALRKTDRWLESIEAFEEGLGYQQTFQSADSVQAMRFLHYLGFMQGKLGNLPVKLHYYQRKLELLEGVEGRHSMKVAKWCMQIGNHYNRMGDLGAALRYLERAREIMSQHHFEAFENRSDLAINLGLAHFHKGEPAEALRQYQQALHLRKRAFPENPAPVAEVYAYLGAAYHELGNTDSSRYCWKKTERELEPKHHPQRLEALLGLAENMDAAALPGLSSEIEQLAEKAYKPQSRERTITWVRLGNYHLHLDRMEEQSIDFYQRGIAELSTEKSETEITEPWLMLAHLGIAQAHWQQYAVTKELETLKKAMAAAEAALHQLERIRKGFVSEQSRKEITGRVYELYRLGARVAVELAQVSGKNTHVATAFRWMESSKANYLMERYQGSIVRNPAVLKPDGFQAWEQTRFSIDFLTARLDGLPEGRLKTDLEAELHSHLNTQEKLLEELEHRIPGFRQSMQESTGVSVVRLQDYLQREEAALVTMLSGPGECLLVMVSGTDMVCHRSTLPNNWEQTIQQLLTSVQKPPLNSTDLQQQYEDYGKAGNLIYQQLLAPLFHQMKLQAFPKRLIFIPDGAGYRLPFDLLPITEVGETTDFHQVDYLLRHTAVSYAHSARMLLSGQKEMARPGHLLAMGLDYAAQATQGQVARLEYARQEIDGIAAYTSLDLLWGEEVLKSKLKERMASPSVLHFTAHTAIDAEQPLRSSILVSAPDGQGIDSLRISEIIQWSMSAKLVVLSACNSGLGKQFQGEGAQSLATAFTYAGCPSTVMSLWSVNDQATASIVADFYDELAKKQPVDLALQAAKLNYLATRTDRLTSHPYYWGALVASGRPEALALEQPKGWMDYGPWAMAVGLLLTGLAYGIKRKRPFRRTAF